MNSDTGFWLFVVGMVLYVALMFAIAFASRTGLSEELEDIEPAEPKTERSITMYSAKWCGPCKKAKPIMLRLRLEGWTVFIIDIDDEPDRAKRNKIRSVPTFFVYDRARLLIRTSNVYTAVKMLRRTQ